MAESIVRAGVVSGAVPEQIVESESGLGGFFIRSGWPHQAAAARRVTFLGVRKARWRQGVGRQLLQVAVNWAAASELRRLELTVAVENLGAVSLYKSAGFEIGGTRKRAVYAEGRYWYDYLMSRMC